MLTRRFFKPTLLITVLAGLLLPLQALSLEETGMGPEPIYRDVLQGDFVVGGASSRIYLGPPQTEPFDVILSGIPTDNCRIARAYANWSYLTDDPEAPSQAAITINGFQIMGDLTGVGTPDLCWGKEYGAAYTADITDIVIAAGGNSTYSIGGATDDPTTVALGEGISLLAIYECPGLPLREIDVYSGYTSNTSTDDSTAKALYWFGDNYIGGSTHFFINALDGQEEGGEDFYLNGQLASGVLPGTVAPGNAWQGLLGPGAPSTNFYDHGEGDSSAFMTPGDIFLVATMDMAGDCVGHSFGAISFNAIPEPSTFALIGVGASLLLLRRRKR